MRQSKMRGWLRNGPRFALRTAVVLGVLGIGATSSASVIQVDFNTVGANPGAAWNQVASSAIGGSPVPLVDSNGDSTGVTMSVDSGFRNSTGTGHSGAFNISAADDYFFVRDLDGPQFGQITIQGLQAGVYQVELIASIATSSPTRWGNYQVNGAYGDSAADGEGYNGHADGYQNGRLMIWEAVAIGMGGTLTILVDGLASPAGNVAVLNAARIAMVPEPASMLLLASGMAMVVGRGRRNGV